MIKLSENSQAAILLTACFTENDSRESSPLSPVAWDHLKSGLASRLLEPGHLLGDDSDSIIRAIERPNMMQDRLRRLLDRSGAMAVAMERWRRAGLWVVTQFDELYPQKLVDRMGEEAPPLLFGSGDTSILKKSGLAVICPDHAGDDGDDFARALGERCASECFSVLVCSFEGACRRAVEGALEMEGLVLALMSDGLMNHSLRGKNRKYINSGNLALVSPFYPEARPNTEKLAEIYKLLYCMSEAALIVSAVPDTGIAFYNAIESLDNGLIPIWTRHEHAGNPANCKLLSKAAKIIPEEITELDLKSLLIHGSNPIPEGRIHQDCHTNKKPEEDYFFELFRERFKTMGSCRGWRLNDLANETGLCQTQLKLWLRRLIEERMVEKRDKSNEFYWISDKPKQGVMFPD